MNKKEREFFRRGFMVGIYILGIVLREMEKQGILLWKLPKPKKPSQRKGGK